MYEMSARKCQSGIVSKHKGLDAFSEVISPVFHQLLFVGYFIKLRLLTDTWCRQDSLTKFGHIVPFGKFHRIGGAPETFPNVKYDAPEEVGDDRICFNSPIRK